MREIIEAAREISADDIRALFASALFGAAVIGWLIASTSTWSA